MNPERWQRIEEVFHAAAARPAGARAAFLSQACAGDEGLRREVERLLAAQEGAASFMNAPALEVAAERLAEEQAGLMTGKTVEHYRILSPLGAGGMGEVYLAEDTKTGRKVALKLLPPYFTKDEQRVRRFQQEAHAVLALNHPNIVTIYEIGEIGGTQFIATEFIKGETLRARLERAPMNLGEALHVALQVGGALVEAHEAGVVHRDIKPENVMLRPDGYVKVLDFGIAKLTERQAPPAATEAPTLMRVRTDPGLVMGTAHYMSPEQARGRAVDERTDVWSLGVVLYEMVAGRAPFEGESAGEVLAAILGQEPPPLARYSRDVPEALEEIVTTALTKDREERYHTVKEMMGALRRLKQRLDAAAELERTTPPEAEAHAADARGGGIATGIEVIGGGIGLYEQHGSIQNRAAGQQSALDVATNAQIANRQQAQQGYVTNQDVYASRMTEYHRQYASGLAGAADASAAQAAGGVNRGASIQIGAINRGTGMELQGNKVRYDSQIEASRITRDAAMEAARLQALSSVVSRVGSKIARDIEKGLEMRY